MNEDVKRRIDKAEKELNEVFYNLLCEHGDNDGHRELDGPSSGFRTLLRHARKWQRRETGKEGKAKGEESRYAIVFGADKEFKEIRMMDGPSEPLEAGQGSVYVFSQKEFKRRTAARSTASATPSAEGRNGRRQRKGKGNEDQ